MDKVMWSQLEQTLLSAVESAILQLMLRQKGTFYCVVFHEFYAELDGPIAMPLLAANTEELILGREDQRWSSADWKRRNIRYLTPELRTLHRAIQKHAVSGNEAIWQSTYSRFMDVYVKVARKLTQQLQKNERTTRDFAVMVFTEDDEVATLRRCLTAGRFRKLFPDLANEKTTQDKLTASPVSDRFQVWREDLYQYQPDILKLGKAAIPFLCDVLLSHAKDDWVAASLLASIGIADARAIQILKDRAASAHDRAQHDAIALAVLGEAAFLLELASQAKTREIAVQGLCCCYSQFMDASQQEHRLDYEPMERLLAIPGCKGRVERLFSGPCEIRPDDVDEALRGLESKHSVIREHAVTVLGNRKLGAQAAKRILPAIAARVQDKSADVRRLAVLSLERWKKAAAPFLANVKPLTKDPDPTVAHFAKRFVKEMT
jgi:hypothetical protein